jgi:two-component system sensor histidine kinase YesM
MSASTDSETGRQMLEVIRRTMGTLRYYVDQLGAQMKNGSKYDENVQALDNIRGISTLIEESVQEYMLFEVNRTGQKYAETQASFAQWLITSALLIALASLFAVLTAWVIAESIYVPLKNCVR